MTDTGITTHLDNLERRMQAVEARLGLNTPTTPAPSPVAKKPAEVLDLRQWKLTTPLPGKDKGKPLEVLQPELATYQHEKWFRTVSGGVAFAAPVVGTTTPNSRNVRTELREMKPGGKGNASWSSTSGTHSMTVELAFTRLPTGNDGVGCVAAQIHDDEDDVQVFRLERNKLWLTNGDETHHKLLIPDYQLGTRITVGWRVSVGSTVAFLNGDRVGTLDRKYSGAYFKAGCYVQANAGAKPMNESNQGEVIVYGLSVTHS